MELAQTLINGLIVSAVGTVLAWMVHGLRKETRQEIGVLRAELATVRLEMRQEIAEIREEIRALRSDLTQVALAVGARPRAENG